MKQKIILTDRQTDRQTGRVDSKCSVVMVQFNIFKQKTSNA